mgnify:CR=1 FL=1
MFNKTIPSETSAIAPLLQESLEYLRALKSQGIAAHVDEFYFALSLDELLTNAVVHGNLHDPGKRIQLSIEPHGYSVEIKVTDQGNGYDPASVPDPRKPECVFRSWGRGIHLVKNVAKVKWNGKGNEVRVRL